MLSTGMMLGGALAADHDSDKLLSPDGGLRNISTNGFVDNAGMVAGFIVEGSTRRFAITGEDQDGNLNAALVLTNLDGTITYESNASWQSHPTATELRNSLRPLGRSSDAGFVVSLAPGVYVARLRAEDGRSARGLVSVTEISTGSGGGLRNISTNGFVDTMGMVAGFIVEGSGTRRLAITGEDQGGGLNAALVLTSLDGSTTYASNDSWRSHPTASELESALRPLGRSSDAGFLVDLGAGVYVARLYAEDGRAARGLVSVTDVGGVVDPRPDLVVDSWFAEWSGDTGDGTFEYRVSNVGQGTAFEDSWDINLMLSPDSTIGDGDDYFMFYEDATFVLEPGEWVYRDETNPAFFNLYVSAFDEPIPDGTYYMAVWVDDLQQVDESNEDNNVSLGSNLVDVFSRKQGDATPAERGATGSAPVPAEALIRQVRIEDDGAGGRRLRMVDTPPRHAR